MPGYSAVRAFSFKTENISAQGCVENLTGATMASLVCGETEPVDLRGKNFLSHLPLVSSGC